MPATTPRLLGIIGHPLKHSLSPLLHGWALTLAGLAMSYNTWPVRADQLPNFVRSMRRLPIHGVSVTMPHKENIIPLLDALSPQADQTGAVNTVYRDQDRLIGHNTDVAGFCAPLAKTWPDPGQRSALVLGAGGAARAVLCGLRQLGFGHIHISARNPEKSRALAEQFSVNLVNWPERVEKSFDLLVNATPLGLRGPLAGLSPWPAKGLERVGLVYDLIYNPLSTRLLHQAEAAGVRTISGLEMFIHQAQGQFHLWTGLKFDPDQARKLLLAGLEGAP